MSVTKSYKKNKYNNRRTRNRNRNRNNKGRRSRNNNNKGRRTRNKNNKKQTKKYRKRGGESRPPVSKTIQNANETLSKMNQFLHNKSKSKLDIKTINSIKDLLSNLEINKETLIEGLKGINDLREDDEMMKYYQPENTKYGVDLENSEKRKELIIKYIKDINSLLEDEAFQGINSVVKENLSRSLLLMNGGRPPRRNPQENPQETTQETPQETPQQTPQETPQQTPQETPQQTSQEKIPHYARPTGQGRRNGSQRKGSQSSSGKVGVVVEMADQLNAVPVEAVEAVTERGLVVSLQGIKNWLVWAKGKLSSSSSSNRNNIDWYSDYLKKATNFFSDRKKFSFIGKNYKIMHPKNFSIYDCLRKTKFNHTTFDPLKLNEKLMNLFSLTKKPFFGNVYKIPEQFKGITWDENIYDIINNIKSISLENKDKEQLMKIIFNKIKSTQLINKMKIAIKDNNEAINLLNEIENTLTTIGSVVEVLAGAGQNVVGDSLGQATTVVGDSLGRATNLAGDSLGQATTVVENLQAGVDAAKALGESAGVFSQLLQFAIQLNNPQALSFIVCFFVGGPLLGLSIVFPLFAILLGAAATTTCIPLMAQFKN